MKTLLIIEPHTDFRTVFRSIIERQGCDVEICEAKSSEEGMIKIRKIKPEITFFDISLREKNGIKLESKIKKVLPNCRIVVLTPFEDKAFYRWHKTDEIETFLSKDKLSENLIGILQEYLDV
ncbi:MAG: response regulator transcription factor [Candidatus Omnitrophica bacterium]|nr:response regulator transcription factor [Candidatus Omnitrophota bacterium]